MKKKYFYEVQIELGEEYYVFIVVPTVKIETENPNKSTKHHTFQSGGNVSISLSADRKSYKEIQPVMDTWFNNTWRLSNINRAKKYGVIRKFDTTGRVSEVSEILGVLPIECRKNGSIKLHADIMKVFYMD